MCKGRRGKREFKLLLPLLPSFYNDSKLHEMASAMLKEPEHADNDAEYIYEDMTGWWGCSFQTGAPSRLTISASRSDDRL